jgi:hypothetical protein
MEKIPGHGPPCSGIWLTGWADGVRAREDDPQCTTDVWGPRCSDSREERKRTREGGWQWGRVVSTRGRVGGAASWATRGEVLGRIGD